MSSQSLSVRPSEWEVVATEAPDARHYGVMGGVREGVRALRPCRGYRRSGLDVSRALIAAGACILVGNCQQERAERDES